MFCLIYVWKFFVALPWAIAFVWRCRRAKHFAVLANGLFQPCNSIEKFVTRCYRHFYAFTRFSAFWKRTHIEGKSFRLFRFHFRLEVQSANFSQYCKVNEWFSIQLCCWHQDDIRYTISQFFFCFFYFVFVVILRPLAKRKWVNRRREEIKNAKHTN